MGQNQNPITPFPILPNFNPPPHPNAFSMGMLEQAATMPMDWTWLAFKSSNNDAWISAVGICWGVLKNV